MRENSHGTTVALVCNGEWSTTPDEEMWRVHARGELWMIAHFPGPALLGDYKCFAWLMFHMRIRLVVLTQIDYFFLDERTRKCLGTYTVQP